MNKNEPQPLFDFLLVRTEDSWWRAADDTGVDQLVLTLVELRSQRSIGKSTMVELHDLFKVLPRGMGLETHSR